MTLLDRQPSDAERLVFYTHFDCWPGEADDDQRDEGLTRERRLVLYGSLAVEAAVAVGHGFESADELEAAGARDDWPAFEKVLTREFLKAGYDVYSSDTMYEVYRAKDSDVEVRFHWSAQHGRCYECGLPAAFAIKGESDKRIEKEEDKRCSVCAANAAAEGERIGRIDQIERTAVEEEDRLLAVWFTAGAIRDHYDDDPQETLPGEEIPVGVMLAELSDQELVVAAGARITYDDVWKLFHNVSADIVTTAWRALPEERRRAALTSRLLGWVDELVPLLESDKSNDWTQELDRLRPILKDLRQS